MSLLLVSLYATVLLAIGVLLRHRAGGRDETWLAGRRLGAWLVAATLTATTIGGSATVVLARFVHANGLAGAWLDLPVGIGLLVFGLFFARRVRASGKTSLPEIAGLQYGPGFRRAVGVLVVLAEIAWFALLVRAAAPFLAALAPLSEDTATLALAAVFVAYTVLGGQAAVAWTDGFQLVLVGLLALGVPAVVVLVETRGLAGLSAPLTNFPTGGGVDLVAVLGFLALTGLPGLVGGDVWSKTLSARDAATARRGVLLAGVLKLAATAAVVVLALGAHLLVPELRTGNDVLPRVLGVALPPALVPLASLGFLAAMMSSADSVLLTGATVLDVDLLPGRAGRWRPRLLILALGVLGTLLALRFANVVTLMKWAYTIFAAGAPLPVLAGFLPRRPPAWAATAALIAGGTTAVATKLAGVARPEPVLLGLAASAACLIAGWVVGRARR